jgi:hypothetical protein
MKLNTILLLALSALLASKCASAVGPEESTVADAAGIGDADTATDAYAGAWCFVTRTTHDTVCYEHGEAGRRACEADRLNHVGEEPTGCVREDAQ